MLEKVSTIATVTTAKAVASGGITATLMSYLGDSEFVMLLFAGTFASTMSYVYDYFHQENERRFTLAECCELFKAIFYGVPVIFIVYKLGINNTPEGVTIPPIVWGSIAAITSASAVSVVGFVSKALKTSVMLFLGRGK